MLEALEKIGKLKRVLGLAAIQEMKPLGIHPKQAHILYHLEKKGAGSLADLSRSTESDPAAVCRMVDQLVKRGLVKEDEHPTDRRRWQLSLTEKGKPLSREVRKLYDGLAVRMTARLNRQERGELLRLLDKILSGFCPDSRKGPRSPEAGPRRR